MNGRQLRILGIILAPSALTWVAAAPAAGEDGPVVFREEGKASYYGEEFEGQKTASGARFDPDQATAAHPTLPLGSEVTVSNPDNGKSVEVEINDRGPAIDGRAIDLSKGAAQEIGIVKEGVAPVEIEATKPQVEEAITNPAEAGEVEDQLREARQAAAKEGTRQPQPMPQLEVPASARN